MSTKAKYRGGVLNYLESANLETVLAMAPCLFLDDFLKPALDTGYWTALDTGGGAETIVTDGNGGQASLALDATNEIQLAGLSFGDHRPFVLNQGLVFEARVKLSVLPTVTAIVCVGLSGDHNAAVDTVAESVWFRLDGATGGLITCETDDTSNETSKVTSGVTVTNADWVNLRIDCTDPASVKFYIDGNQVAGGTTFNMSQVAALTLQPMLRVSKAANTNLGTMLVDKVMVYQKRA